MIHSRRPLVLALVAALVDLVVVVLPIRPGGQPDPTSPSTPTAVATASQTTGSGIGGGGLAAPTVVANPKAGVVEFSWSYSGSQPTDTYRVHVGTSAEDAQIADPIALSKAAYSVKVRSGTQACLIAILVRSGQTSPASPAVCGTAR